MDSRLCNIVAHRSNAEEVEFALRDLVAFLRRTYARLAGYIDDLEVIWRAERGDWDLDPDDDDGIWTERPPAPRL